MKIMQTAEQQHLGIHFLMLEYGWAELHFHLNEYTNVIRLSDVFDPFEGLMNWLANIADNHLPAEIYINEEGFISLLHINRHDDEHIRFSIHNAKNNETFMNIICHQATFEQQFRTELIRFFQEDFAPNHWGNRDFDPDEGDMYYDLKNIVLKHYQCHD